MALQKFMVLEGNTSNSKSSPLKIILRQTTSAIEKSSQKRLPRTEFQKSPPKVQSLAVDRPQLQKKKPRNFLRRLQNCLQKVEGQEISRHIHLDQKMIIIKAEELAVVIVTVANSEQEGFLGTKVSVAKSQEKIKIKKKKKN